MAPKPASVVTAPKRGEHEGRDRRAQPDQQQHEEHADGDQLACRVVAIDSSLAARGRASAGR